MTTATAPSYLNEGRVPREESLFAYLSPRAERKAAPAPAPAAPTPEVAPDLSHTWVAAAEIEVTPRIASIADFDDAL
ncbi:hypothetical protein ABZ891_18425 [Streptomyces sp. NPDC047023]|uniref:hypothetical protein n=1 Tax=Streptomyces sp. NPDC047023 TaxID=3155139 RepID=UPI0033CC6AA7